jgi:hypothetical protein
MRTEEEVRAELKKTKTLFEKAMSQYPHFGDGTKLVGWIECLEWWLNDKGGE